MKIMMADGKEVSTTEVQPTYIVTSNSTQDNAPKKGGITKKHVLMAVSAIVIAAITLIAILVGMHMFSQAQKEIVKFSLQFKDSDDENAKQDVESDPNDNVVMTTVTRAGQDAKIVSDFNKGIQIVKLSTGDGVSCLVLALNRSVAMDPLHISGPDSMNGDKKERAQETYLISEEPVADRSFLPKKALDMCKGVSVYWVTRQCAQKVDYNNTSSGDRTKRAVFPINSLYGLRGLHGCCYGYWACELLVIESLQANGLYYCQIFYKTGTCCVRNAYYPSGVAAPYCNNVYVAKLC